ncbi:hypothetical protein AJ80_06796 [Polytolypa hystricis UAMH7299]|uniref:1-phosphatidylinositol-4-phosphate 5-kinase n=1 Tax=Polytolypa hystricis (strain UAMH7299) TaxID=1447883 RepID=A0A2B7XUG9_POLH7|nr:hypothetical protein AJ80_06796 [Polytolypa hystricis UAMH7299]
MPSFAQEPQLLPTSTSTHSLFDHPPRKSHDKSSLSNAFVWTSDVNGENGHLDDSSDHFVHPYKGGSFQSLTTTKSGRSSYGHERTNSRNGSVLSMNGGSIRERGKENGLAAGPHDGLLSNGVADVGGRGSRSTDMAADSLVNGTSSKLRSQSPRTVMNGDRTPIDDRLSTDLTPPTSTVPSSSTLDGVVPGPSQQPAQSTHRHSSPAAPITTDIESPASPSHPTSPKLVHRHTLQVPKFSSGRKPSRESSSTNVDPSDDSIAGSDRLSSPSTGLRRPSLSLARRTTRSINSDLHLDEVPQDEDAARWTEAIKQKRASKRRRKEEEDDDRVIVGTKVDQNHVNWVTAYNMLTGIRFTVSRINAKLDRELTDADFEAKHKFSFDITGNELTPSAKYDFKFKDYAPWVFRRLRAKFKLDPADYLMSLTSKYILSELGSPGKSGSFFYFSRDYKYIIKTIHHAEHKLLRRILRDYYQHIENNPNTLISQFYGLHRVKIAYGRKIHFVVMNNLFPPHRDIHQMFDLKGSTIGRDFREEDLESNPRATLKDLNWLRRDRHLECGPRKREVFLAQLKRDVALLQRLNIMDYSLLVGIHDMTKGNEEKLRDRTLQVFQPGGDRGEDQQPNLLMRTPSRLENARKARELREIIKREKPIPMEQAAAKMPDEILDERNNLVFYSDDGGFRASHENGQPGDEIYYLGVIDCLTHYGMVKKVEHFWKGLSHNRNQISPIPPEAYGERFINFVTAITMSKEEAERDRQAQAEATASKEAADRRPLSPTERMMKQAEKETIKANRTLAKDPEPADRIFGTRAGPIELPGASHTLPVVEEVGEASSTGDRSGRSGASGVEQKEETPEPEANGAIYGLLRNEFRTASGPSGPPPARPPPPPKPNAAPALGHGNGKSRVWEDRGNNLTLQSDDKDLPPLPSDFPRPPPSPSLSKSKSRYTAHISSR